MIDSITKLQDASAQVVEKGQLKKGKKVRYKIDVANIVSGKILVPAVAAIASNQYFFTQFSLVNNSITQSM